MCGDHPFTLQTAAAYSEAMTGDRGADPSGAALWALLKVIAAEAPAAAIRGIDYDLLDVDSIKSGTVPAEVDSSPHDKERGGGMIGQACVYLAAIWRLLMSMHSAREAQLLERRQGNEAPKACMLLVDVIFSL